MMLKNLRIQKLQSLIKLKKKRSYCQNATQCEDLNKAKRFCNKNCSMAELELIFETQNTLFQNWLN